MEKKHGGEERVDAQAELVIKGVLVATIVLAVGMFLLLNAKTQAEGFSQIYLNENAIPKTIGAGQPLPVAFTIENYEGRQMRYSYSISDSNGTVLKTGSAAIDNGAGRQVVESVQLKEQGQQKVFISVKPDSGKELSLYFPVQVN
ncbi:MAG: DUF1616 domain-containing protein [Candidatus Micrarchaeota archaeon]